MTIHKQATERSGPGSERRARQRSACGRTIDRSCDNATMTERPQSRAEELANSLSHGGALLAAVAVTPFLIAASVPAGAGHIVGTAAFCATMMLLYFTSTLYHALPHGRAKNVFMRLDHIAIYFFIAGSYTPFALGALMGPWGWTLFGLVWTMALVGTILKSTNMLKHPWLSTGLYVAMGWIVLIAAVPLVRHVPMPGVALLVAGGVAYTGGVVFYLLDSRLRYAHTVWHGFVVAGTTCHFLAVLSYSA
jgi:hemolysin III